MGIRTRWLPVGSAVVAPLAVASVFCPAVETWTAMLQIAGLLAGAVGAVVMAFPERTRALLDRLPGSGLDGADGPGRLRDVRAGQSKLREQKVLEDGDPGFESIADLLERKANLARSPDLIGRKRGLTTFGPDQVRFEYEGESGFHPVAPPGVVDAWIDEYVERRLDRRVRLAGLQSFAAGVGLELLAYALPALGPWLASVSRCPLL